jgi:hypothetical protein
LRNVITPADRFSTVIWYAIEIAPRSSTANPASGSCSIRRTAFVRSDVVVVAHPMRRIIGTATIHDRTAECILDLCLVSIGGRRRRWFVLRTQFGKR